MTAATEQCFSKHLGDAEVEVKHPSDGGPAERPEVIALTGETNDVP